MFGLQALGAIGKGVSDGAEEIRRMNRDAREKEQAAMQKEQFGWARDQQSRQSAQQKMQDEALKELYESEKAMTTNFDGWSESFGGKYNSNEGIFGDGKKGEFVKNADGKVTHVRVGGRDKDGNDNYEVLEWNPEIGRSAARAAAMAKISGSSPELLIQSIKDQYARDQFDKTYKQRFEILDRQLTNQSAIAEGNNQTSRDIYARNNATQIEVANINQKGRNAGGGGGGAGTRSYVTAFKDLVKTNMELGNMSPTAAANMARLQLQQMGMNPSAGTNEQDLAKTIIAGLTKGEGAGAGMAAAPKGLSPNWREDIRKQQNEIAIEAQNRWKQQNSNIISDPSGSIYLAE
jgi:hypothetical protein